MISYYATLLERYPILSIEDGLSELDWKGWKRLTEKLGNKVQLVGDDIFVTNVEIFSKGIKEGIGNSISDQTQSDRDSDGNLGCDRTGEAVGLHGDHFTSFR